MRGQDTQQAGMFSYLSPEERVPAPHPLRPIRHYVDTALTALSPQLATLVCPHGPAFDCPGEAAARPVAAGALQSSQ